MNVQEQVLELLAPIVATLSVELYDVEFSGSTLRVLVEDTAGAITTDRLAQVNRLISPILDQHDPIPGRYTLEVSSPGLERPLKRPAHLQRAVGEEVLVKMESSVKPRRYKGRLTAFEPDTHEIVVEAAEVDGVPAAEPEAHRLDMASVATIRTVFSWGPGPKPGAAKTGAAKPGQAKAAKARPRQPDKTQPGSPEESPTPEVSDEQ